MIIEELGNEYLSVMNKNLRHSGIDIIEDVPWEHISVSSTKPGKI